MDDVTMSTWRQHGFTLIEMMLAIAIFALLSLMAVEVLRSLMQSQNKIQSKTDEIVKTTLALALMERDISQATVRLTTEGRGNLADFQVLKSSGDELELVHRHWANPGAMLERSSLERVRYRLVDDQLQRLSYPDPDARQAQARIIPILQGVEHFQLRFWYEGRWEEGGNDKVVLPAAVEVTVELSSVGHLRRVILLNGVTL